MKAQELTKLSPDIFQELLPEICRIAKDAGEIIMRIFEQRPEHGFDIQTKDDDSPVTTADLEANTFIERELKKLSLLFPILSEESKQPSFEERSAQETYWLIDPLDGTKEFIKRRKGFTVNIALIHKNKSVLGVVNAPALGLNYFACRGTGSFKEVISDSSIRRIHARPLPKAKATFAVSREHVGKTTEQFFDAFKADYTDYDLVRMGSSLKMCMVAEGSVDLYPRLWPTSEWDTAAAHCIVEEAGGQLVQTDMSPLLYNTKNSLLNPFFFAIGNNTINWSNYLPTDN